MYRSEAIKREEHEARAEETVETEPSIIDKAVDVKKEVTNGTPVAVSRNKKRRAAKEQVFKEYRRAAIHMYHFDKETPG